MTIYRTSELNQHLTENQASWRARDTLHGLLPDDAKRRLLGVRLNETDRAAAMAPHLLAGAAAPAFDPEVDWRNRGGQNHVTPVKNQAACGSCVSFCTVAVTESMASIESGRTLDLSEADLHFCSVHGPTCEGWWPQDAFAELQGRGVCDEACFPYASAFNPAPGPACRACPDRDARAVTISRTGTIASVVDRKNYLTASGPCSAVIHVFDDFFSYGSGVYRHVTGADVGLHCITVIGYSQADGCWICKNSWGGSWGDAGFFRIAYGEAGIDTEFPFWTAEGVIIP